MKRVKLFAVSFVALAGIAIVSAFSVSTSEKEELVLVKPNKDVQTVNLFVTHGHCSLPFAGIVEDLKITAPAREDGGNPIEDMEVSFDIDPNSFNVCRGEDLTKRVKTPGLFIGENNEKITFRSTSVYTVGINWYQVNGKLSIKGVEKEVKLFATGIRKPEESKPSSLVLEGQLDLFDWGIDYDKIVSGKSDAVPTRWMYLNMTIEM